LNSRIVALAPFSPPSLSAASTLALRASSALARAMPELPEVEKARRLVHDLAIGSPISRVHRPIIDDKVFVDVASGQFERALSGRKITHSKRHGKQLWWQLDGNDALVPCFHFGMTGAFVARGIDGIQYYNSKASGTGDWPPRFAKLVVAFENGVELAFVDPRRFGKIKLVADVAEVIGQLGPDPLLEMPNEEAFAALWRRRSAPIKTAIMDQKVIAGIGNWMADGASNRSIAVARRFLE
jgi:formamidopyrimidine-DNA glycosylase